MGFVRDTSCHDDHLSQIIFKSHHAVQSYGPNTILEHTTKTYTHMHMHTRTGLTLYALSPFQGVGIKIWIGDTIVDT